MSWWAIIDRFFDCFVSPFGGHQNSNGSLDCSAGIIAEAKAIGFQRSPQRFRYLFRCLPSVQSCRPGSLPHKRGARLTPMALT